METTIKTKDTNNKLNFSIKKDDVNGFYICRNDRRNVTRYVTSTGNNIKFWKTLKGAEKKYNDMINF